MCVHVCLMLLGNVWLNLTAGFYFLECSTPSVLRAALHVVTFVLLISLTRLIIILPNLLQISGLLEFTRTEFLNVCQRLFPCRSGC